MIKKCKTCGNNFMTSLAEIKNGRGINCSKECSDKSMVKRIDIGCDFCKKVFSIRPCRLFRHTKDGRFKKKVLFCSNYCKNEWNKKISIPKMNSLVSKMSGLENGNFGKKGKSISYDGYYLYSNKKLHRIIMEKHIGRKILPIEIVHHINFDKLDNRIENLQIVSRSEHNKIHRFLTKEVHCENSTS